VEGAVALCISLTFPKALLVTDNGNEIGKMHPGRRIILIPVFDELMSESIIRESEMGVV
jgi:hypothetical protein